MISPKEKADLLFNKMDMIIYTDQDNWKSQCIRCALIAVDEILKSVPKQPSISITMPHFEATVYWEEVKQELEKL